MLPQCLPPIFSAKQSALLQDGHHIVDKGRSAIRQHVRNDIETIDRTGAEPCLNRIRDLLGCAHDQAMPKRLARASNGTSR